MYYSHSYLQFMQTIQHLLSKSVRGLLRKLYYFVIGHDLFTLKRLLFYYFPGSRRTMERVNESIVQLLLLEGLKSTDRVLEIGFGSGRLARKLLGYLNDTGKYTGLDVLPKEVEWCRRRIGRQHPNFRFEHADIFNRLYNPRGKIKASSYRFPWNDDAFDFVVLVSVFTHMLPQEIDNYLSEIARVLRRGGKCFATFFVLNDESKRLVDLGAASVNLKSDLGGYRTVDKETPESIVAYDEDLLRRLYDDSGLKILEPVLYGSWSGRKESRSHQDIVLSARHCHTPDAPTGFLGNPLIKHVPAIIDASQPHARDRCSVDENRS